MSLRNFLGVKRERKRNRGHQNFSVNPLCRTGEILIFIERTTRLAARLGVEPRQNESESFVLPLHHRAVRNRAPGADFLRITDRELEPAMGFEPATACLQNRCSTVELRRPWLGRLRTRSVRHFPSELGLRKNVVDANATKSGGSPGTRTPNQLIKSQLLYH